MLKPVNKNTLYQGIIDQIMELIKEGTWTSGQKLPGELELSESFSVSRNVLREALKSLELSGIIEAKSGKGTFLSEDVMVNIKRMELLNTLKSKNSLTELLETRLAIESSLARLACKNRTEEEVTELKRKLDLNVEARKSGKYKVEYGIDFHMYIAEISKNKILFNVLSSIIEDIAAQKMMYVDEYVIDHKWNTDIQDHIDVYEAIRDRDEQRAFDIMYNHIGKKIYDKELC